VGTTAGFSGLAAAPYSILFRSSPLVPLLPLVPILLPALQIFVHVSIAVVTPFLFDVLPRFIFEFPPTM
jgi:hypothetical protein